MVEIAIKILKIHAHLQSKCKNSSTGRFFLFAVSNWHFLKAKMALSDQILFTNGYLRDLCNIFILLFKSKKLNEIPLLEENTITHSCEV